MTRRTRNAVAAARLSLDGLGRSVVFRDPMSSVRRRIQQIDELSVRAHGGLVGRLSSARDALGRPAGRLAALHPVHLAAASAARLQHLQHRLVWALGRRAKVSGDIIGDMSRRLAAGSPVHRIALAAQQIDAAARQLEAMSHRAVLGRGFSLTRDSNGNILRSASETSDGQTITTELSDGKVTSVVGPTGVRRKKKPASDDSATLFD
jgi:exodeoxyribonuclease VII large subunit